MPCGRPAMWRDGAGRGAAREEKKEAQLARWRDEEEDDEEVVVKASGDGKQGAVGGGDGFLQGLLEEAMAVRARIEARLRPKLLEIGTRLVLELADGQRADSAVGFPPDY